MGYETILSFQLTKVHTGPLLHHLEGHTKNNTTEVAVGRAPSTGKAAEPAALHVLRLKLVVGLELGELILDVVGVGGLAAQPAQGLGSIFGTVPSDVPARRLKDGLVMLLDDIKECHHTSGSRNRPVPRIKAQANWMAMGIR